MKSKPNFGSNLKIKVYINKIPKSVSKTKKEKHKMADMGKFISGKMKLKSEDIKEDDVLKILDSGKPVEFKDKLTGKDKSILVFNVFFKKEEREISFNKKSIFKVSEKYGLDSEGWVGKWVKCILKEFYPQFGKSGNLFTALGDDTNTELDKKYWNDRPTNSEEKEPTKVSPDDVEW